MVFKRIDSPEGVADCRDSRVLFTLPYSSDHIKNWEELGRTGAMLCCFRPNVRKRWTSFAMSNFGAEYGLLLGEDGLKRGITSVVQEKVSKGILKGILSMELIHRKVASGDFDDFQRMGEYAVRRFSYIASDLTRGLKENLESSIWYAGEAERVFQQSTGDWRFYQARVSEAFYDLFCRTVLKGDNHLLSAQSKTLVKLVASLNVKAVDERYGNVVLYNQESN
jgi:hypothetical protein